MIEEMITLKGGLNLGHKNNKKRHGHAAFLYVMDY